MVLILGSAASIHVTLTLLLNWASALKLRVKDVLPVLLGVKELPTDLILFIGSAAMYDVSSVMLPVSSLHASTLVIWQWYIAGTSGQNVGHEKLTTWKWTGMTEIKW